jgi:hypothetical protein
MRVTLANLAKATEQQVFDQVVTHLLTQRRKASIVVRAPKARTMCRYRGENDTQCAAGCLISDEEYSQALEANGWADLCASARVPADHQDLIEALQDTHDHEHPDYWYDSLKTLAQQRSLQFNPPPIQDEDHTQNIS